MAGVGGVGGPNEPQKMEAFKPGEIANMLAELRNSQVQPNSIFGGNKNVIPPNNALYEEELAAAAEKNNEAVETAQEKGVPNNEEDKTVQLKKVFGEYRTIKDSEKKLQEELDYYKKHFTELEARLMEEREKREMEKMDAMEQERLEAEALEALEALEAEKAKNALREKIRKTIRYE